MTNNSFVEHDLAQQNHTFHNQKIDYIPLGLKKTRRNGNYPPNMMFQPFVKQSVSIKTVED